MTKEEKLKQFDDKIFPIKDHLECGNPECTYCREGRWCYHLTDKDWKEIMEEISKLID